MLGRILGGRYRVLGEIGRGGMGIVYEGEDTSTGAAVAIKVIRSAELTGRPDVALRFEREARAVRAIDSAHVVRVLDVGALAGEDAPYLVMERLRGRTLEQAIAERGRLAPEAALRIVAEACRGLGAAHAAGIVHRDVKPANLYLAEQESGRPVKVLDFGVAKLKQAIRGPDDAAALTRSGHLLGSPLYMSPEQAMGLRNVDARTDVWSLGAVLYEALAGRAPHAGVSPVGLLLVTICTRPAPPIQGLAPWVSDEAAALVHRALTIERDARLPSVDAMLEAIGRLPPDRLGVDEDRLAGAPAGGDGGHEGSAQTTVRDGPPTGAGETLRDTGGRGGPGG